MVMMKPYSEEDLNKMPRETLRELLDLYAEKGIIVEMSDYPKSTKPYLVQAVMDAQEKRLEQHKVPSQSVIIEVTPSPAHAQGEVPEVKKEEVTKPLNNGGYDMALPPKHGLPDWRELPDDTPEQWVRKMYLRLLGREPDSRGLATYVNHIKGHMKKSVIEETIRNSDEYKRVHGH